jgi:hypothetical protein
VAHDVDGIEQARDAVARESWVEAYAMLRDIEPSDLAPADLEGLADATWWLSKVDESIAARQKAYAGYAAEGNDPRAGFMAGRLAVEHFDRGDPAVAMGWLMKAQRHLSDRPESVEHGFLSWIDLPIFGEDGEPLHDRGAATNAPGLYFVGLPFQYAASSDVLPGVGRDARYVVKHLVAQAGTRPNRAEMTTAA